MGKKDMFYDFFMLNVHGQIQSTFLLQPNMGLQLMGWDAVTS